MIGMPAATRSLADSAALALAGLLLVGWAWRLAAVIDRHEAQWAALTVGVVVLGYAALGLLRAAQVGMNAPQIMLVLGAAGMAGGLAYDVPAGGMAALAYRCLEASGDFLGTLRLHWRELPGMHLGMVAGGLLTVPLLRALRKGGRRQFCARLLQNLVCSAWMIAGMSAGTMLFMRLAAALGGRSAAAMLGGMFGGMVWGMVASVAVYRLWFAWRTRMDAARLSL